MPLKKSFTPRVDFLSRASANIYDVGYKQPILVYRGGRLQKMITAKTRFSIPLVELTGQSLMGISRALLKLEKRGVWDATCMIAIFGHQIGLLCTQCVIAKYWKE